MTSPNTGDVFSQISQLSQQISDNLGTVGTFTINVKGTDVKVTIPKRQFGARLIVALEIMKKFGNVRGSLTALKKAVSLGGIRKKEYEKLTAMCEDLDNINTIMQSVKNGWGEDPRGSEGAEKALEVLENLSAVHVGLTGETGSMAALREKLSKIESSVIGGIPVSRLDVFRENIRKAYGSLCSIYDDECREQQELLNFDCTEKTMAELKDRRNAIGRALSKREALEKTRIMLLKTEKQMSSVGSHRTIKDLPAEQKLKELESDVERKMQELFGKQCDTLEQDFESYKNIEAQNDAMTGEYEKFISSLSSEGPPASEPATPTSHKSKKSEFVGFPFKVAGKLAGKLHGFKSAKGSVSEPLSRTDSQTNLFEKRHESFVPTEKNQQIKTMAEKLTDGSEALKALKRKLVESLQSLYQESRDLQRCGIALEGKESLFEDVAKFVDIQLEADDISDDHEGRASDVEEEGASVGIHPADLDVQQKKPLGEMFPRQASTAPKEAMIDYIMEVGQRSDAATFVFSAMNAIIGDKPLKSWKQEGDSATYSLTFDKKYEGDAVVDDQTVHITLPSNLTIKCEYQSKSEVMKMEFLKPRPTAKIGRIPVSLKSLSVDKDGNFTLSPTAENFLARKGLEVLLKAVPDSKLSMSFNEVFEMFLSVKWQSKK